MRSAAVAVLPLFLISCGGSSPAPTSPAPVSILDLAPGSYTLNVTMSQSGVPVCNGAVCMTISFCVAAASAPAGGATTAVLVERTGSAIKIRPLDPSFSFRMDLGMAGSDLGGTASGQFRDGPVLITVAGDRLQEAIATGTLTPGSASGRIDGQVSIGGYGCSNNGHVWTLVPR